MITRLPARREDKIIANLISATKAIIEIDAGTRSIEKDVARDCRLCRLGLHVETALLFVEAHLSCSVSQDLIVARMIPICAIHARLRIVCIGRVIRETTVLCLVGVTPGSDGGATNVGEVVV